MATTVTNHLAAYCLSEMASCFTNQTASNPIRMFIIKMWLIRGSLNPGTFS
jgi:hypothetical protein